MEEDRSRKERAAEELRKLKQLTWKQRLVYIWDYYKPGMAAIVAVIVVISTAVQIIHNLNTTELLNAVFMNCNYYTGNTEGFEQEFIDYLGGLSKNEKLSLDFTLTKSDTFDNEYMAAQTKIMAYNMNGNLDCMIMPESIYREYQEQEMFMSLETVLSEEELAGWKEYLVQEKLPEAEEERSYAVRVETSAALKQYGLYGDEAVYFAIPGNTDQTEMTVRFLHFLMDR